MDMVLLLSGGTMSGNHSIAILAGQNIKLLRLKAGYTIPEFARLSSCKSEQQLYRYERGINKIDIDTLIILLRVLNIDVKYFFDKLFDDYEKLNDSNKYD